MSATRKAPVREHHHFRQLIMVTITMVLLATLCFSFLGAAQDNANVYISSVCFNAPGNDITNLNGEWIRIVNTGKEPIPMGGWKLSDQGNKHVYTFPGFTIGPETAVMVYTGKGIDTDRELFMGFSEPVWNNDGDIATLEDNTGSIISRYDDISGLPAVSPLSIQATPAAPPATLDSQASPSELSVHFINVGQSESILLISGDWTMLIDGGTIDQGDKVSAYLKEHGVKDIDVLVATHPHSDHIGGLIQVMNEFPVKMVLDSGQIHTTRTYEQFLTIIDQKDIPYVQAERGQKYTFGQNLVVEVLNPPSTYITDDLNENSVVLKVTFGNVKFLFTGDAGFDAEKSMLASGVGLDSDVLKVAHHGSAYATGEYFLSKVMPAVSVIEVGENNYGHPSPETLDRLKAAGSAVYRTDLNGNIVIMTDGTTYKVTDESGAATIYSTVPGEPSPVTPSPLTERIPGLDKLVYLIVLVALIILAILVIYWILPGKRIKRRK